MTSHECSGVQQVTHYECECKENHSVQSTTKIISDSIIKIIQRAHDMTAKLALNNR